MRDKSHSLFDLFDSVLGEKKPNVPAKKSTAYVEIVSLQENEFEIEFPPIADPNK